MTKSSTETPEQREQRCARTRRRYAERCADPMFVASRRAAHRRYQMANPRRHLTRAYGLAVVEYERMLVAQDGRCAVCGKSFSRTAEVDHDHATGAIRGLVCKRCNALVAALENPLIERATAYLRAAR